MRIAVFTILVLGFCSPTWAQQHFTNCLPNNSNDATVIFPEDITVNFGDRNSLTTGDEIALYSDDNRCAGVVVWDSTKSALSIAVADRDSIAGITEGYETDESLKYRIWRQSDDREFNVSSTTYTCNLLECRTDGLYERDAVFEATEMTVSSPLPVELSNFEAALSNQSVVLQWRTMSETNNSGFRVQHKPPSGDSWSTLSFVEGAGTTTQPQDYQYKADDLGYGRHQFRLAQVDQDGSRSTTKTVEAEVSLNRAYEVSRIYPNPVRQQGTLDLTVKEAQEVTGRLYDVLGREQGILFNRPLSADQTETIQLDTDQLPSGQYFLRIEGEQFQVTRRVTVVK